MLLHTDIAGGIFVPEVDWCSTNINQNYPISTEKNRFPIQEKPNNPISVNFFFSFIQSVEKTYPIEETCHRNMESKILSKDDKPKNEN